MMSNTIIKVREAQYKKPTPYIGIVAFRGTLSKGSLETELFLRRAAIVDSRERFFGLGCGAVL